MKNKILVRVLALLGALITVASVAVVPTFASMWNDSDRRQLIEFKINSDNTDKLFGFDYADRGDTWIGRGYDLVRYEDSEGGIRFSYTNDFIFHEDLQSSLSSFSCTKLEFRFYRGSSYYEYVGSHGEYSICYYCYVYADDSLILTFYRSCIKIEPLDDPKSAYYEDFCSKVRFADGREVSFSDGKCFYFYFKVRHEWLTACSIELVEMGQAESFPIYSYFDSAYSVSPSQYDLGWNTGYGEGLGDGRDEGYQDGYSFGYVDGKQDGWDTGYGEGLGDGRGEGYQDGYVDGKQDGWDTGYGEGLGDGRGEGYQDGYYDGRLDGLDEGRGEGYRDGYDDGEAVGWKNGEAHGITETQNTVKGIKDLVFAIFDAPTRLIDGMLDFDLFGINLASTVKVIVTLAVVSVIVAVIIKFSKG